MKSKVILFVAFLVLVALAFAAPFVIDAAAQAGNAAPVAFEEAGIVQQEDAPVSPVELPVELRALIASFIGFLVTAGLKSLSAMLQKDITGWAAVITGGLSTSLIFFFNAILSAIPVEAQPSATIALALVVSILSAFGVARTVKKMQPV